MSEKLTQGEQAEKQANAFVDASLSKVAKPPSGKGPKYCKECGDEINPKRREVFGNGLCIDCAKFIESKI